jgi:hypothetical protein
MGFRRGQFLGCSDHRAAQMLVPLLIVAATAMSAAVGLVCWTLLVRPALAPSRAPATKCKQEVCRDPVRTPAPHETLVATPRVKLCPLGRQWVVKGQFETPGAERIGCRFVFGTARACEVAAVR